jgi:LPXTG-motif cell wall-anchored protein
VFYVAGAPSSIPDFNGVGGSGRVVLRYTVAALAATGANAIAPLGVGAVLAGLGAMLFAVSRRRTRSES